MKRSTLLPLILTTCILCGTLVQCRSSRSQSTPPGQRESRATYTNPVVNQDLPDPTVLRDSDGTFFLMATESAVRNVPILKSTDLVHWEQIGTAFTDATRPTFEPEGRIWAPDLSKIGDRYVIHYSMSKWGGEWTCGIGVAVADRPEGPYQDLGLLFRSNEIGVQNSIDPFYIEEDGHHYLIWGSFRGIYYIELTSDGLRVKEGSEPVRLGGTDFEASYIFKRNGYYYYFGSVGACCNGLESTYTTVVARSRSLFGPYVNKDGRELKDNGYEVIVRGGNGFVGTGHNSEIVEDDEGETWLFYHAFKVSDPHGRRLMLDRLSWEDDWPVVEDTTPSTEARVPFFRKK